LWGLQAKHATEVEALQAKAAKLDARLKPREEALQARAVELDARAVRFEALEEGEKAMRRDVVALSGDMAAQRERTVVRERSSDPPSSFVVGLWLLEVEVEQLGCSTCRRDTQNTYHRCCGRGQTARPARGVKFNPGHVLHQAMAARESGVAHQERECKERAAEVRTREAAAVEREAAAARAVESHRATQEALERQLAALEADQLLITQNKQSALVAAHKLADAERQQVGRDHVLFVARRWVKAELTGCAWSRLTPPPRSRPPRSWSGTRAS
jgi:hypothetical protein